MPAPLIRALGSIALRLGLINQAQIDECVAEQKKLAAAGPAPKLGRLLVVRGYLTDEALDRVLAEQKRVVAAHEKDGWTRIGVGDAFRLIGSSTDALREYRSIIDDFADCLPICADARRKIAEIEAELRT